MSIDYDSLDAYGGFEGMLNNVLRTNEAIFLGSAHEDFSIIVLNILTNQSPGEALRRTGKKNRQENLSTEIRSGIDRLTQEKKEEVVAKIKSLLRR